MPDDRFERVAALADLPADTLLSIELAGRKICLVNVEGEVYALQDNCSHKDFPLSAGELTDGRVQCTWHGAQFDVRTGRALCLPAIRPVKTFEVKVEGEEIYVAI